MSQTQNKIPRQQIDGIFLLNKHTGISSNHALQRVKRIFNAKKAGHTGSLDPLATGVLPICLGEATKFSGYLLDADKAYRVTAKLGSATDTLDSEGAVIATSEQQVPQDWEPLLEKFRGEIEQVPPMYSALKYNGKKLYELAREGKSVERKSRQVRIYQLTLLSADTDHISLDVICSKGTYIRTLVDDLGQLSGCLAHVVKLERYKVADFLLQNSMTIADLEKYVVTDNPQKLLLQIDSAVLQFPKLTLTKQQVIDLFHGKQFAADFVSDSLVRVYDNTNKFLGLVEVARKIVKSKRLISFA